MQLHSHANATASHAHASVESVEIEEGLACSPVSLWQLADSAFPAGALAHSNGLEAAYQSGRVSGSEDLYKFIVELLHALACNSLPALSAARSAESLQKILSVDSMFDALLATNHVSKRASLAQGRGFLNASAAAFPHLNLKSLRKDVEARGAFAGHLAPIFGLVCRRLGVTDLDARRLFLFMALRYYPVAVAAPLSNPSYVVFPAGGMTST